MPTVFVPSLSTTSNTMGSKPGRASSCHHPPVLEMAHLALSLVRRNGSALSAVPSLAHPTRSRSTFASKHCAVAHRPMPARFGEINVLLRPRPKSPPTRRFYAIPSAPVASHYHCGRGANNTKNCVVAQVEGTGPVLPILEGSHRVCP